MRKPATLTIRPLTIILLLAVLLSVAFVAAAAPNFYYKLSTDDPLPVGGDVDDFKVSPDGLMTVYRAGQDIAELRQLYSVPSDGSAAPKPVSALPDRRHNIQEYSISPDNAYVVYNADQDEEDLYELYSAPLDGSAPPQKISGEMVEGGGLRDNSGSYQISPDGTFVVYRAQQDIDEVYELYRVPIDGSAEPIKLNPALPEGRFLGSYAISPDNQYVLYTSDQETDNVTELFRVMADGSDSAVKLSGVLVENGDVSTFKISPDSSFVAYLADQDTNDVRELYRTPMDAGVPPIKLNGTLVAGGEVGFGSTYYISPNSQYVVYLADQDTNNVDELYSVPSAGGVPPVKLNDPLPPGAGGVSWVWDPQISPDSSRVVFLADEDTAGLEELHSAPITGGGSTKLNGPLMGNFMNYFAITPDNSRVVYRARQDSPDQYELYSVPLAGGGSTKISAPLGADANVGSFDLGPNSAIAVYSVQYDPPGSTYQLFRTAIAGGAVSRVNGDLPTGGRTRRIQIAPSGNRILYTADQETLGVDELFETSLNAAGPITKLNPRLAEGADIWDFVITHNSKYVFYLADHDRIFDNDVYRVRTDGSDEPLRLSDHMGKRITSYDLEVTANDAYALFIEQEHLQPDWLYSVPVEAGTPLKKLNYTTVPNAQIHYFRLSDDSQYVVYRATLETAGMYEIFSTKVDGSGLQVKLNGTLIPDTDVHSFRISPTSKRVVYTAEQDTADMVQIYSVPIGGGTPQMLNGPLAPGRSVEENNFAISPDGQWVAYVSDEDTEDVPELYLVPIDGSAPPVKVNGPLVEDGEVNWFQFGPAGNYLIYAAYQEDAARQDLYGVTLPGPGAPVKLNHTLGADQRVDDFDFSPDGSYGVYLVSATFGPSAAAQPDAAGAAEVEGTGFYSVSIPDGVRQKLTPDFAADQGVYDLDISPDGVYLVYTVYSGILPDSTAESPLALYSVPVDGSGEVKRLDDPDGEYGEYLDFWITSDSERVIYGNPYNPPDHTFRLYAASIDGRGTPGMLAIPMVEGGSPERTRLSPDDSRMVYTADQDTIEVEELYATTLPEPDVPDLPGEPDELIYLPVAMRK